MMAIISLKDDRCIEVNQKFLDTLGLNRDSVVGQTPGALNMWLDDGDLNNFKQEFIQNRRLERRNLRIRAASGRIIDAWVWAELLSNDGDELCLISLQEFTEHTEKLHLNQRRLEALEALNQMSDASIEEVTEFAYKEAIKLTKSDIGWLAFVSEDEKNLRVSSWSDSAYAKCNIPNSKNPPNIRRLPVGGSHSPALPHYH